MSAALIGAAADCQGVESQSTALSVRNVASIERGGTLRKVDRTRFKKPPTVLAQLTLKQVAAVLRDKGIKMSRSEVWKTERRAKRKMLAAFLALGVLI